MDHFRYKNKAFLEGVRAVNGRKMETNWKAVSDRCCYPAWGGRIEHFPSTDHVHQQCKQSDKGETWGDLLARKKTWKRIKYQAVNRTERKSRDQVSRIAATLPQPLATDYLLWGGEGPIKYCPVKPVPFDTQEAQTKKKDLCFIVHGSAQKSGPKTKPSLGDTLLCDFYFPPAELGLLDVLDAEVAAAVSVDLGLVPRGGLIIGAVGVGRSCETENTRADCCGKKNAHVRRSRLWNVRSKATPCGGNGLAEDNRHCYMYY